MDFHDKNKKGQEPQNTVSDWEKPFERPDPDAPQPVSEVWEDSEEAFDKAKETLKTEEAVNIEEAVKAEETLKVEEAAESETADHRQDSNAEEAVMDNIILEGIGTSSEKPKKEKERQKRQGEEEKTSRRCAAFRSFGYEQRRGNHVPQRRSFGDGAARSGGDQGEHYDFAQRFYRVCADDFGRVYFFIVARISDSGEYVYDYRRRIHRVRAAVRFARTYRQNAGGACLG